MVFQIPLDPEQLYHRCDPNHFDFESTSEIKELVQPLGQERAIAALNFGVNMRRDGYNVFVLGPTGGGRHRLVQKIINEIAAESPTPNEWCYLYNFDDPQKPMTFGVPAGVGSNLKTDFKTFIENVASAIPAAFDSKIFSTQEKEIEESFRKRQEDAFKALEEDSLQQQIAFIRTDAGFAFAPLRSGRILRPDEFSKLDLAQQDKYGSAIEQLEKKLSELLDEIPKWQQEMRLSVRQLMAKTARLAVSHLADRLKDKYVGLPVIQNHVDKISADIIENIDLFRTQEQAAVPFPMASGSLPALLRRYQVNLIVDHSKIRGAPVVYSSNPTHDNLIGKTEYLAHMGTLVTDFLLIRPGELHRANGGFLIIEAHKILTQPFAWDALKRALLAGEINIESLAETLGLVHTVTLEPETIPLDIKVILIGERFVYYLLCEHDPDFGKLFKVAADFEEDIDRTDANVQKLVQQIATIVRTEKMRPYHKSALARIVEYCSRIIEHGKKISIHLGHITDLLHEADYWAGVNHHPMVFSDDVEKAISEQLYRTDRVRIRLQERVIEGSVLIDTTGKKVGQVNGLSVINLGNRWFGQPSRVTATARPGEGKIVDIENESKLAGDIYSKSVMILSHFLMARYARSKPLSLLASVGFEQSYGEIEGDSASLADLLALLSAISGIPLKQNLAVTGSINQFGEVQVIGGVNEKIEGFFDVCDAIGLTGDQGVVIPAANVQHLMLKSEVVEACKNKKFFVYAVQNVDQAIELFSDLPAGARGDDGTFQDDTFNFAIEAQLLEMAELVHASETTQLQSNPAAESSPS